MPTRTFAEALTVVAILAHTPDGIFLPIVAGKALRGIQGRERLATVSGNGTNDNRRR